MLDEMFALAKEYYLTQDYETEKKPFTMGKDHIGYVGIGGQTLDPSGIPDNKEVLPPMICSLDSNGELTAAPRLLKLFNFAKFGPQVGWNSPVVALIQLLNMFYATFQFFNSFTR